MTRSLWIASGWIVLATLVSALGLTLGRQELLAPVITIFGVLCLVAMQRGWKWVNPLALVVFIITAGYGVWKGITPGLMLILVIAALSAWDLESLAERLKRVKPVAVEPGIEQRHLARLLRVDAAGLVLGGLALVMRINLSFALILLLGVVVAYGLSQLILYLRRSNR